MLLSTLPLVFKVRVGFEVEIESELMLSNSSTEHICSMILAESLETRVNSLMRDSFRSSLIPLSIKWIPARVFDKRTPSFISSSKAYSPRFLFSTMNMPERSTWMRVVEVANIYFICWIVATLVLWLRRLFLYRLRFCRLLLPASL